MPLRKFGQCGPLEGLANFAISLLQARVDQQLGTHPVEFPKPVKSPLPDEDVAGRVVNTELVRAVVGFVPNVGGVPPVVVPAVGFGRAVVESAPNKEYGPPAVEFENRFVEPEAVVVGRPPLPSALFAVTSAFRFFLSCSKLVAILLTTPTKNSPRLTICSNRSSRTSSWMCRTVASVNTSSKALSLVVLTASSSTSKNPFAFHLLSTIACTRVVAVAWSRGML